MLEYLPAGGKIAVALFFVASIVRQWSAHRAARREHPPMGYEAPAALAPWRWAAPPDPLRLIREGGDGLSRLRLPDHPVRGVHVLGLVFGALLGFGALAVLLALPFRVGAWGPLLWLQLGCFVLFAALATGALRAGDHVVAIELRPDDAVLTLAYAVWLRTRVTIRRTPGVRFDGKLAPVWATSMGQQAPDFHLTVRGRGPFRGARRFVLYCNQSEGTWIVGALQRWVTAGQPEERGLRDERATAPR